MVQISYESLDKQSTLPETLRKLVNNIVAIKCDSLRIKCSPKNACMIHVTKTLHLIG